MKNKRIAVFSIIVLLIGLITYTAFNGLGTESYRIQSIEESVKLGLDIEGGVVVVFEAQTDKTAEELAQLMDQTKTVISRRINQLGLTEPNVMIEGTKRIRIELPGVEDAQAALDLVGQTAQLKFTLVDEKSFAMNGMMIEDFESTDILTGENVKKATLGFNDKNQPGVDLQLDAEGSKLFEEATKKAVAYEAGQGQIAIVLDDEVISAPFTSSVFSDGRAQIVGNFTAESASNLAALIRGGALPVELKEVKSDIIGPTLGLDALKSSINAAKIGCALVIIFMIGYYRVPGLIATITLILYGSLLLFIMNAFGATLTLPGVAGIVLSVGMAVDANVIIFERIKEELSVGKTLRTSVEAGFSRALRTIIDANVTTLIAAVVLFNFGEGPIKGFAVTLMIGIATSMFTAVIVTKTLLKNSLAIGVFNNPKLFGAKEVK